jgi:DNA-binding NtrC family response regulator
MASGQIRSDFYYLVSVMPIEVPPLGRRREDLPLLVSHFLEQATEDGAAKLYTPGAIKQLATTDWPAEVRGLFDLVKQGVVLNQDPVATPAAAAHVPSYEEARQQFTHDYLVNNLQRRSGAPGQAQSHRFLQIAVALSRPPRRLQAERGPVAQRRCLEGRAEKGLPRTTLNLKCRGKVFKCRGLKEQRCRR